jgi:hypothetical protein
MFLFDVLKLNLTNPNWPARKNPTQQVHRAGIGHCFFDLAGNSELSSKTMEVWYVSKIGTMRR